MQLNGLRILSPVGDFEVHPRVIGDLKMAPPAGVIFLGVKALGARAARATDQAADHLERVDPGGVIAASIDRRRVLASIVYFSTDIVEPGVIQHTEGNRISLGEPDGSRSERVRQISETLVRSG